MESKIQIQPWAPTPDNTSQQRAAPIGLLNTPGYQSEKTLDLDNAPNTFLTEFDKRDRKVSKDEAVAHYALEGLPNKVMAAEYRTALPDEKTLAAEIRRTQEILRKREALLLPPREEIRVKKTSIKKRSSKRVREK